jgi:hypothetical protein
MSIKFGLRLDHGRDLAAHLVIESCPGEQHALATHLRSEIAFVLHGRDLEPAPLVGSVIPAHALLVGHTCLDTVSHHAAQLLNGGAAVCTVPGAHLLALAVSGAEDVMHVVVALVALARWCVHGPHDGQIPRAGHVVCDRRGQASALVR